MTLVAGILIVLGILLGARWFWLHDVTTSQGGGAFLEAVGIGLLFLTGSLVWYVDQKLCKAPVSPTRDL
jgi:hypothetical protein